MLPRTSSIWQRDSHPTASGKPGAVHSDGKEQFDQVMTAVRASPELVALGKDGRDQERFTSRDMIAVEARLERSAGALAARDGHGIADRQRDAAIGAAQGRGLVLSAEQRDALDHITGRKGLASVVGYAGSGKSAMLGVAREAWERQGYQVRGAALSGIAAENLEGGSGISSRTISRSSRSFSSRAAGTCLASFGSSNPSIAMLSATLFRSARSISSSRSRRMS